jgi:hypothetical protein
MGRVILRRPGRHRGGRGLGRPAGSAAWLVPPPFAPQFEALHAARHRREAGRLVEADATPVAPQHPQGHAGLALRLQGAQGAIHQCPASAMAPVVRVGIEGPDLTAVRRSLPVPAGPVAEKGLHPSSVVAGHPGARFPRGQDPLPAQHPLLHREPGQVVRVQQTGVSGLPGLHMDAGQIADVRSGGGVDAHAADAVGPLPPGTQSAGATLSK